MDAPQVENHVSARPPNRREFLYMMGGASLAIMTAGSCGAIIRFLQPPPRYGWESGRFLLALDEVPEAGDVPLPVVEGGYYLVRVENGLVAFDPRCPFWRDTNRDNARVRWVQSNQRYECPVCGSKFSLDGSYIEGPAGRALDRFTLEMTTEQGTFITPADGSPIDIESATQIVVDTNRIIYGQARS